ncbi:MAG: peroxiredoxin [Fimbriimonadaceae bacterium]|jgi:peroxiredoxin|nr:peroxiredoxin [Fimbriimonadaceae bacterium]
MAIAVGTQAPDFSLRSKNDDGLVDVKLSDNFSKKNTVVLFFPAAFTGVCTDQLCDMTSGLSDFDGLDAHVIAISADSPFAQEAWAKQNSIKLTLASDYQKTTIAAYDVVLPDLVGLGPGSKRAAFVIDKEGIVRYSEETPTPLEKPNAQAILDTLKNLA